MMRGHVCVLAGATVVVTIVCAAPSAEAASCTDVPIGVTILNNAVDPITGAVTASALVSDGGGEYLNGTSNVSATIHVCDGTNDAILNSSSPKRRFIYQFPAPIQGSVIQSEPAWVPGSHNVSGWINVRNLLYSHQAFTTHMGTTFIGPDRASYRLAFMPVNVDAPDLHPVSDNENTPYDSSPAKVYPQAFDCNAGGTTKPSWLVVGNNLNSLGIMEVGTLYKLASGTHTTDTHEGQYTMPFELRIDALTCFTY
jgi:hypothetical protein